MKEQPIASNETAASPSHHERRCAICRHSDREAIEEQFLHWHNPCDIANEFDLQTRSVYRHAHALHLFERRDRNLRFALGHLVQRAQNVRASADAVVRAVHAYTRVNRAGEWVEPPSHVIVSSGSHLAAPAPPSRPTLADTSTHFPPEEMQNQFDSTRPTESEPTH